MWGMSSRVLVPMDTSEMAEKALRFALEAFPDAEITVFHVVGGPTPYMGEAVGLALSDDITKATEQRAEVVFSRAREVASEYETHIDTAVGLGSPSRKIIEQAERFDLIVIGSHGRDLVSRLLIGNVAETVTRRSPVPVTVVR